MNARLIKRGKSEKPIRSKAQENPPTPCPKTTATIVREWVGQHQKIQGSARQAFAALFIEPEMRNAT
jgi:hypothetical protein